DKSRTLTLDPLTDDLAAPSGGKAKVRVVNATTGIGKLDVIGPDGKIFTGVGNNSSTSYKDVNPMRGTIEVRRGDKSVDVLRIANQNLQNGKIYTIIVVGGSGQPVEAVTVSDEQTPSGIGG